VGDFSASLIVALIALGMGVSFFLADPESRTSRALALCLGLLGTTKLLNLASVHLPGSAPWPRLFSLTEAGALLAGLEWLRRVGRVGEPAEAGAGGDRLVRAAQACALAYGLIGAAFPALRAGTVDSRRFDLAMLATPGGILLTGPFYAALALAAVRSAQLVRRRQDPAERVRLTGLSLAAPFLVSGFFVSPRVESLLTAIGEIVFFGTSLRYHVVLGRRGEFLGRFLSPQVARVVRERGLDATMQRTRVQISVLACDLRGFTAFAETAEPEEVMHLLGDYHAAVAGAVHASSATIKDFAGDGVLVLVGAPIPCADHAARAVALGLGLMDQTHRVLGRWTRLGLTIGLGCGVASGFVTLGVLDAAGRLEYTAVGPAVNLAARLCERARDGEILADHRTVGLCQEQGGPQVFEALELAELKGIARPVQVYAVRPRMPAAVPGA
jgi:adenylate cyclase